jgi:hypothetical protein
VFTPYIAVILLAWSVYGKLFDLVMRVWSGVLKVTRTIATALASIQAALQGIASTVDGLVSGIAGGVADLLTFVLDTLLGPLKGYLDGVSNLWDQYIGDYLASQDSLRHPLGYMWNDVWYEWGTGPLGEEPHDPDGRVVEHLASEARLVAAIGEYSRANGGLARALWAPA